MNIGAVGSQHGKNVGGGSLANEKHNPARPLLDLDVGKVANSGSYSKAVALLRTNAVRILIRCADGAVEASVQSERGNESYAVRVGSNRSGDVAVRCECFDFKRRGGLCKHGASLLLMLQRERGIAEGAQGRGCPCRAGAAMTRLASTPGPKRQKVDSEFVDDGRVHGVRGTERVPSACGRRVGEDVQEAEMAEAISPPALPRPRFPTRVPVPQPAPGPGRRGALKAALTARLLIAQAASGDSEGFVAELRRRGPDAAPLEDPAALLHKALLCDKEAGGNSIAEAILSLPVEGPAAVNAADCFGSAPLHNAVSSQRLGVCRRLLELRADVRAKDSKGRTPLELARSRRLDSNVWRLEDPFVELLRQADPSVPV